MSEPTFQEKVDAYKAQLEAEKPPTQEELILQFEDVCQKLDDAQTLVISLKAVQRQIAIECHESGISQHVLAEVAGCTRQRIYQIIRLTS